MTRVLTLSFVAAMLAAPLPASAAGKKSAVKVAAADQVQCTIRTAVGSEKKGGIDKRLSKLRKQFSKPPFSAFKSIKLLSTRSLNIAQGAAQRTTLPNSKVLKLTFKERLLAQGKQRLRLHLSITKPKSRKFLPGTLYTIADGGTLLVGGAQHQGGTLIFAITCKAK